MADIKPIRPEPRGVRQMIDELEEHFDEIECLVLVSKRKDGAFVSDWMEGSGVEFIGMIELLKAQLLKMRFEPS